jgi:predicted anti-sigma-YlaC factor YlaD
MKWMITCKEASRIISDGLEKELPLIDRILVRSHLVMCKTCGYYKKQITALKDLLGNCSDSEHLSYPDSLPDNTREQIKTLLKQNDL